MSEADILRLFPQIDTRGFRVTSENTPRYNCIGWAMEDDQNRWWPQEGWYWPPGVPRQCTIEAFSQAFATRGYAIDPTNSAESEDGFQKVALYARNDSPTHAARQIGSAWTSKLGQLEDISHATPQCVAGGGYGQVVRMFRRAVIAPPTVSTARLVLQRRAKGKRRF